jgi:hypothetical protein
VDAHHGSPGRRAGGDYGTGEDRRGQHDEPGVRCDPRDIPTGLDDEYRDEKAQYRQHEH